MTRVPGPVLASFWILLISLVLDAIWRVVVIASGGVIIGAGGASSSGVAAGALMLTASIVSLMIDIVEILVVFRMRAGQSWARWVLTVLLALQLGIVATGAASVVGGVVWIVSCVALLLLWLPASRPHFQRG